MAGLYVLACDVYPDITPEIFYKVAMETSNKLECAVNSQIYTIPHVINPINLIENLNKLNK
ncbi:MAG: hypothetical protein RR891_05375 [Clostridium sp.]|uniref:hypothetical protein n=1 Tax=Clostridium sp. TaxID=1506 RepID=UPI003052E42A